jgi:hypothetical protein
MSDDSQHTHHCPMCEQSARERDEAREQADRWRDHYNNLIGHVPPGLLRLINKGQAYWWGHERTGEDDAQP